MLAIYIDPLQNYYSIHSSSCHYFRINQIKCQVVILAKKLSKTLINEIKAHIEIGKPFWIVFDPMKHSILNFIKPFKDRKDIIKIFMNQFNLELRICSICRGKSIKNETWKNKIDCSTLIKICAC